MGKNSTAISPFFGKKSDGTFFSNKIKIRTDEILYDENRQK